MLRSYPQHDAEAQQPTQQEFSHVDAENGGFVSDVADVADQSLTPERMQAQLIAQLPKWMREETDA